MRVFVIGNAALDETLSVSEFPHPGESIFGALLSRDLGGKGLNQAVAIARTGLSGTLVAAVGSDARGREIAERLAVEPLAARLVQVSDVATDFSTILMAEKGDNAIITTRGAAASLTPDHARDALQRSSAGDLLVMQGNLGAETTRVAFEIARDRGLRTALNPSPLQPYFQPLLPFVDSAFVNQGEAEALGGVEAILAHGVGEVVLTLGSGGAALFRPEDRVDMPAHACTVVDTTGAGDCFLAVALGSAGLRGARLDARALRHAAKAAAHTVGRAGTVGAFPDRAEMQAILRE